MDSTDMRSHIQKQGISAVKTLEKNRRQIENFAANAEFDRIIINGAGDKYLVGLTASYLWRKFGREPLSVIHSRDLADNPPYMDEKSLVIFYSQSGKTKDTVDAAKVVVEKKAQSVLITNLREELPNSLWSLKKQGGTIFTTQTEIYPERSLPSTMTFQATLSTLWHLLAELSGKNMYDELKSSAQLTDELSRDKGVENAAKKMAERLAKEQSARYVMGDGPRYGLARKLGLIMCMEGVKINAFPLESEEFLHSAIETLENENEVKLSNTVFMPPRGATFRNNAEKLVKFWSDYGTVHRIEAIEGVNDLFNPQPQIVLPIWVAYHEALLRGVDPGIGKLVSKIRSSGF